MPTYDLFRNSANAGLQPGRNASQGALQAPAVTTPGGRPQVQGAAPGPAGGFAASVAPSSPQSGLTQGLPQGGIPQGAFTAAGDGANPLISANMMQAGQPPGGSILGAFRNALSQPFGQFGAPGNQTRRS